MQPSEEQSEIIQLIEESNVLVDSVAGSGKTTTNLFIARTYPHWNILLLTYNAKLRLETKARLGDIKNLEVHTYHSFAVKNYNPEAFTDKGIRKALYAQSATHFYNLIILDEIQDMTMLYYQFVCKIFNDNVIKAKMCLVGDRYQSIYDFMGADARFIIYGHELFNFAGSWAHRSLSTSYRMTEGIANFVNYCMLGEKRIHTVRDGPKPDYIICNCFAPTAIVDYLDELLKNHAPENIFILAPSVRSKKSPVCRFENELKTRTGVPVHIPDSDESRIDPEVIKGKLVFSTFHQAKGLEREVVVIFGFDDSYFDYYKKDRPRDICPNELYVATTRARSHLILLHHYKNHYLQFLKKEQLNHVNMINFKSLKAGEGSSSTKTEYSVTELLRHIPSQAFDYCRSMLRITEIKPARETLAIPIKINGTDGAEFVATINGIAIPLYYEWKRYGTPQILGYVQEKLMEDNSILKDKWIELNTHEDVTHLAILYSSLMDQLLFKFMQINDYSWITEEHYDRACDRLQFIHDGKFEQMVHYKVGAIKIHGTIDCIDDVNVYEFKCVNKLEDKHIVQLALYSLMYEAEHYYLYNIYTDQMLEIAASTEDLNMIAHYLVNLKVNRRSIIPDANFLHGAIENRIIGQHISAPINHDGFLEMKVPKMPIRISPEQFNKFDQIPTNTIRDYLKFINCINPDTNRHITYGGRVWKTLHDRFLIDDIEFSQFSVDQESYHKKTTEIFEYHRELKSLIEAHNQLIVLVNQMLAFDTWDEYIEIGGIKYGTPFRRKKDIHIVCGGNIIAEVCEKCGYQF